MSIEEITDEEKKSIDEKIQRLGEEERREFDEIVKNLSYVKHWCIMHHINYADPNRQKVERIVYRERYGNLK